MIRIVIIGFGKIAQIAHLDSIFNNSNVVLSGIIDINGVDKDIVKKYNLNFLQFFNCKNILPILQIKPYNIKYKI